jgi:tetratricopeptide (TPR) repeat protein
MATHDGKAGRTGAKGRRKSTPDAAHAQLPDALFDALPDRRLLERELTAMSRLLSQRDFASIEEANAFMQDLPRTEPSTALEQAQEVVYLALQTHGARRVALAHKALTLSPDCADAYVLLAEAATDPQEARRLYEQGIAAGERALGVEMLTALRQEEGAFWGLVETRPYLRAREGLAHVLWHLGERAAAIEQGQALLHLNPGDNQGIRYLLATWLLAVGDAEAEVALEELLAQYPDEWSAHWAYTQALQAFRRHGAGRQADQALKRALEVNPHVPLYLLGVLPFPEEWPATYGMGDEQEAVVYLAQAAEPWLETPGAAEWVATVMLRLAGPALAAQSTGRASTTRAARTPGTSTTTKSPASKSPASKSPASKSPASKSPASKSPAHRSTRPRQPRRPRNT